MYNEEASIGKTLTYLEDSLKQLSFTSKPTILTCINGCEDNSKQVVKNAAKKYAFPIKVLECEKGKIIAHKEMLKRVKHNHPVLFMDADVLVPKQTINLLLQTLETERQVSIASAYPYVLKPKNMNLYQRWMYSTLNIKRIDPNIEITKGDVSDYHKGKKGKFKKRSRIYLHGRCFAVKKEQASLQVP